MAKKIVQAAPTPQLARDYAAGWPNRILAYAEVDPAQLLAHEGNPWTHPPQQTRSLEAALGDLGWLAPVVVNRRTARAWPRDQRNQSVIIDGHMRAQMAASRGQHAIPVVFVDLAPDEEEAALASLNAIALQVAPHKEKFAALWRRVQESRAHLADTLADVVRRTAAAREELPFLASTAAAGQPVSASPLDQQRQTAATERIPLAIVIDTLTARRWRQYKERIGEKRDSQAFVALLDAVMDSDCQSDCQQEVI
jgi:hypothetical protein